MLDAFDATLVETANVLARTQGTPDDYGVANPVFQTLATGVKCRVSLGKGKVKEWKAEKKIAKNYKCVFMRPWFDGQGNPLTHDHWLFINGQYYDIFQIDDPGLIGHHLEVWCELVIV